MVVATVLQKVEKLTLIPDSTTDFLWDFKQTLKSESTQIYVHGQSWGTLIEVEVHRAGSKIRLAQGALYWNCLSPS